MRLCTVCGNMYYIAIDNNNTNKLLYYCKKCQHTDDSLSNKSHCVYETVVNKTHNHVTNNLNPYLKYDPTLPHSKLHPCPNEECTNNNKDGKESDVIVIRYDESNMKYMYICELCNTSWTSFDKLA